MTRRRSRPSRSKEAPAAAEDVPSVDLPVVERTEAEAQADVPMESGVAATVTESEPGVAEETSVTRETETSASPAADAAEVPALEGALASGGVAEMERAGDSAGEAMAGEAASVVSAAVEVGSGVDRVEGTTTGEAAGGGGEGPLELKFVVEALLFSAQKALTTKELKDQLVAAAQDETAPEAAVYRKIKEAEIGAALEILRAEHAAAGRSYRLCCVAGAWQFASEARYAPWLRAVLGRKARPPRLSQPGIETLTIIAYRQPVTRAEIEQIRGVSVDGVMQTLLERGLVVAVGRAEVIGRPVTYGTTPAFLEYFGLRALEDLPAADELRRIPVQKPEALLTVDPGLATAPAEAPVPEMDLPSVDPQAAGAVPEAAAVASEPSVVGEGSSEPDGSGSSSSSSSSADSGSGSGSGSSSSPSDR